MNASVGQGRERRYFPRVDFRGNATLITTSRKWPVHILDLSFNGALAALLDPHELHAGEEIILALELKDGKKIKMQGKLAHQRKHFLGLECRATGIDNQARLRELLDKNTHPELHNRQLNELVPSASLHSPDSHSKTKH